MYYNYFICSTVDGCLCCFHIALKLLHYVAATVNSAAMSTGVHVSLSIMVFSEIYPVVGLLRDMVALVLVFKEISILFFIVAMPPVQEGSPFSTSSPAIIVCRFFFFFDDGYSDWCKLIPLCSFDLHFSNNERCWAFICLLAIGMSFLERYLFLILSVTSVPFSVLGSDKGRAATGFHCYTFLSSNYRTILQKLHWTLNYIANLI